MTTITSPPLSVGTLPSHSETLDFVRAEDIQLFEANLLQEKPKEGAMGEQIIEKFGAVSSDIAEKKVVFEERLHKAARTGESSDILAATRAMSDYYLQTAMSTKIASKATSAIDRITNLQ